LIFSVRFQCKNNSLSYLRWKADGVLASVRQARFGKLVSLQPR